MCADRASAELWARKIEPNVRMGEFSDGEREFTPDDWHRFFATLRMEIDPLDFSCNVGWWCLKLLWAVAWFKAEEELLSRSWRITEMLRSAIVREIGKRAVGGQSVKEIAEALGVTTSTLRTWRRC